jgi:sugar phosphate permease
VDFPDSPKTKFLTPKEKAFVNERLSWDRGKDEVHKVTWRTIMEDLQDWKVWSCAWIYFSATLGTYAMGFFLPKILKNSLGFSQAASFLLNGAQDAFAVLVSYLLSWLSDRVKKRGLFVSFQAVMSIVGLTMLAYAKTPATRWVTMVTTSTYLMSTDDAAGLLAHFWGRLAPTQLSLQHWLGKPTIADKDGRERSPALCKSCLGHQEDWRRRTSSDNR